MFFLSLGFIYFFNLLNFYPVTRFLVTPLLVTRYYVTLFSNTRDKAVPQGPEEMCLSLEHQNPSKTSEKMGYFDHVTVSLHIL